MAAAKQKAMMAPLRPPSACPTSTRKTVIAVNKNAVLRLFPIAVYVDANAEGKDAPTLRAEMQCWIDDVESRVWSSRCCAATLPGRFAQQVGSPATVASRSFAARPGQRAPQRLLQRRASLVVLLGRELSLLALDLQREQLFLQRGQQQIARGSLWLYARRAAVGCAGTREAAATVGPKAAATRAPPPRPAWCARGSRCRRLPRR